MAYTTGTFGTSPNVYGYTAPDGVLYCFSPYYIEITGTTSNQKVTLTVNSTSVIRYTNTDNKCKFPLRTLLQSCFYGVDMSTILAEETGVYTNAASKLWEDANITCVVGTDTSNPLILTRNVVYGALQTNFVFQNVINIFCWRSGFTCLPLTVTPPVGDYISKDYWVSSWITESELVRDLELFDGVTLAITYKITELPYCTGGHYMRWLDTSAEYKYFYFAPGLIKDELKDGATIQQNVWGLDDLKSDIVLKSKEGNETYECGVLTANYAQQIHLIGLQRSIKQWIWENDNWVECRINMPPIAINRFRSPIEIHLTIIKPSLYLQTL